MDRFATARAVEWAFEAMCTAWSEADFSEVLQRGHFAVAASGAAGPVQENPPSKAGADRGGVALQVQTRQRWAFFLVL
jgi:hypothetical protein